VVPELPELTVGRAVLVSPLSVEEALDPERGFVLHVVDPPSHQMAVCEAVSVVVELTPSWSQ
jgi:hypothetical protein